MTHINLLRLPIYSDQTDPFLDVGTNSGTPIVRTHAALAALENRRSFRERAESVRTNLGYVTHTTVPTRVCRALLRSHGISFRLQTALRSVPHLAAHFRVMLHMRFSKLLPSHTARVYTLSTTPRAHFAPRRSDLSNRPKRMIPLMFPYNFENIPTTDATQFFPTTHNDEMIIGLLLTW